MLRLHFRKETVIFFVGMISIVGIVVFYGNAYFQKNKQKTPASVTASNSFATKDIYISYDTLKEKRSADKSNIILIDIRANELFASEHIPQSTNIPFEMIDALTVKDGFNFVIITSVGNEQGLGAIAAQTLHDKNGKAPIFILKGGFEGWKNASGQTISFGNPESVTDQAKVNYITPQDLKKRLDSHQSYFILDMRPKDMYDQGHVTNAVNLPFDQLENSYEKIPIGVKIVAYGNSKIEDFQSGVRLFDLGFFSTEVLKGGFAAWKDAKFDVQK